MKNSLLVRGLGCALMLLLLTLNLKAQVPDDYRTKMNSVFANLNKTYITTGYLSEYAFPFIPLENFNGTLNANNVTNTQIWQMAYATWYTSYIASSSTPGTNPSVVNTSTYTALNSSTNIPILLLYGKYNSLKTNAVSSNLLSVSNSQFYDVAGRSQTPYDERTLFVAAPGKTFSSTNVVSFIFNSSLSFGNGGSISSIAIDFGEGAGYQTASWGTALSHTFNSVGNKRIKVRVTPAVGSTVENHFDFQIYSNDVCNICRFGTSFYTSHTFAATTSHSGGIGYIRYSQNNTSSPKRLKKPLIVVEGFDVHSIAPNLAENYSYRDFILNLNDLGGATGTFDFNGSLDDSNYDLIFLDYNNGTDDIIRNAALLQDLIIWVNGQKVTGDSDNVVMGLSMGGLVGRYALAKMVRNSIATQTRLFIAHDSPQRGANVPLGVQVAPRHLGALGFLGLFTARDVIPELDQTLKLFDATATGQLLINKVTNSTGSISANSFLNNDYWNMVNLPSAPPYRLVATSDGSQCGVALFSPSTQLANFTASGFLTPLPWINNNRLTTTLTINSSANQSTSTVFNVSLSSVFNLLSVISINVPIASHSVTGASIPFYDGAPGGTYPVSDYLGSEFKPSASFKVLWFLQAGYSSTLRDEFCFVPTASALDVTNFTASNLTASNIDAVSPGNPSRLGKFIAQESFTKPSTSATAYNEKHIRFTARNGQWLYNEMENPSINTLHCSTECSFSGISITGPSLICTTGTYSLSPALNFVTPTWSSSNTGLLTINSVSGLATKVGNAQYATVSSLINGCNVGLSKTVYVGTPTAPSLLYVPNASPDNQLCRNTDTAITLTNSNQTSQSVTQYDWSAGSWASYLITYPGTPIPTTYALFNVPSSGPTSQSISVTAQNACGVSSPITKIFVTVACGGPISRMAYPNPASDILTLGFEESNHKLPEQILLYNEESQKVVYSITYEELAIALSKAMTIDIPVKNYPRGTYYLHIVKSEGDVDKTRVILE
ncbi:T9SS type A sorting domain-containing protein [Dyadobacter subterraneus]|uniref:Secretion system C-terminal sorting domain-containing protein n=1 Tax=Dyadobacter subterraneus TaxID=2773304 RepID=A0ABR9WE20_9BACT|nr:T9SS type A sorting domain-containing protein [Dyadobacter subterraneus]MBE9463747.1 hypothetical protein [Dyadobacter subterraneus]